MEKTNALEMRRALGKVLEKLERHGEPILVEKNREPKAVLISLRDFEERFVDRVATEERERLMKDILALRRRVPRSRKKAVAVVRQVRGPLP